MDDKLYRLRYDNLLRRPPFESPAALVRWMGAVQAQDYPPALWAVGQRIAPSLESVVETAIAEGEIVRTWPMRGTIHFAPAEDVHWMLRLMTPRVIALAQGRLRQLELDDRILGKSREVLARSLDGGQQLARAALYADLNVAGISTEGQRGYHILWHAAQSGLICSGPRQGRGHTFVLLDEWVSNKRTLTHEEALSTVASRYFRSHGPATLHDFAWWTGLTLKEAREAIEFAGTDLEAVTGEGGPYWMGHDTGPAGTGAPRAHLISPLDEFLVSFRDRSPMRDAAHAADVDFKNSVVWDGRCVGTWTRTLVAREVRVNVRPFGRLPRGVAQAIEEAARAYADFLGLALNLSIDQESAPSRHTRLEAPRSRST